MKVGDLVRYRRGELAWIGVVVRVHHVSRSNVRRDIRLIDAMMDDGVHTYKHWKLEVISECR